MKHIKIGLARLYNARFIEEPKNDPIIWELDYRGIKVISKLSTTISFGTMGAITAQTQQKGSSSPDKKRTITEPGPDKFPADLYFEIISYKLVAISDELSTALETSDTNARNEVIESIESHLYLLKDSINYTAGVLGLRVMPELVATPIFDVDYLHIFLSNEVYSIKAGYVFQTKTVGRITHETDKPIVLSTDKIRINNKNDIQKTTECLTWLLRGWAAQDYVLKFLSFFTALEMVIPGPSAEVTNDFNATRQKLIAIIKNSELKDLTDEKLDLFFSKKQPASLFFRFQRLAEEAKLNNWMADVNDFKIFNRTRNKLLHQGDLSLAESQHITNEQLNSFELLASKYVKYIIYGDKKEIYNNQIRKSIISIIGNFKVEE